MAVFTHPTKLKILETYKEVVNDSENGDLWKAAIREELLILLGNKTWEERVLLPDTHLISTKWVFSIKYKPDGTLERFKARLVVRGFT